MWVEGEVVMWPGGKMGFEGEGGSFLGLGQFGCRCGLWVCLRPRIGFVRIEHVRLMTCASRTEFFTMSEQRPMTLAYVYHSCA